MNRGFPALALLATLAVACAAEPPSRSPLPEVGDVLDPPAQCAFLVGDPQGVLVQEVIPASAAEGVLIAGDIIVSFDGEPIADSVALLAALSDRSVGDVVDVGFLRDEEESRGTLTLGANPDAGSTGPRIGVMIRTHYQTVPAAEIATRLTPGPLIRPISIAGTIFLLDPVSYTWERTQVEVRDELNWVPTTSGLYAIGDGVITELTGDEEVPQDGFGEWEPLRLIGSIGADLMLVVTQAVADGTGRLAVGISRFDPSRGTSVWTEPVEDGFGIPVLAMGSPNGEVMVLAGVGQEGSEITGVEVRDGEGSVVDAPGLVDLGTPVGWTDEATMLFRTDVDLATLLEMSGWRTERIELEQAVRGLPLFPVGDSRKVIAVDDRALLLDDLTVTGDLRLLAENCDFGRVGEPGWDG